MPSELRCSSAAGIGAKQSNYQPSQSAKTFLKEFFELNPPTRLDPAHQTTSLTSSQMIQFVRAVGIEVALALYGMSEDLLVKSGVGTRVGAGLAIGGRLLYPIQVGLTVVESLASALQYSLPTIRKAVTESNEHFGRLETDKNLFAGNDMPLSQEVSGNTQSNGTESSLTLQQTMKKSQAEAKS